MKIEKSKNCIILSSKYFSVKQILNSGQVFRFKPYKNGYFLCAGKQAALLNTYNDKVEIICTDENYFYKYFDLDTDYEKIAKQLQKYPFLDKAIDYGKGIRILKQEKTETIFDFIISSNNNIKRISGIIENICNSLGDKKIFNGISYNTFPDINKLSSVNVEFYKMAGAGYRARYLYNTATEIKNGFNINFVNNIDTTNLSKHLMQLQGIGKKVADCILLFAYNKTDVFPVDVWIEKVYNEYYCSKKNLNRDKIADYFVNLFGNYSGYAQQYFYYYKRDFRG